MATHTAPVFPISVRTLIAFIIADISCSGLVTLSQYFVTALKASFVVTDRLFVCSTCCNTGSGCLVANVSPGSRSTGILFAVAVPAAVSILAAPGPTDVVQAYIFFLFFCFAKAVAASAIPCSFLP